MRVKNLIGSIVLDKNANDIGKVTDINFKPEDSTINSIIVSLQKNIVSHDEFEIKYSDIKTIGKYILLKTEISSDEEAAETATVELVDE